ncbi:efflux RND transporter periplasmic adaptor subunit [Oleiharenicola lentus]|uniref:efflux RND transporter periplasmic adaptor subunit n=1 Tax=Oleiharenicola lentus TaxID=2508720 RepID=UPI003F664868
MKFFPLLLLATTLPLLAQPATPSPDSADAAAETTRRASLVVLDATAVKNLGLLTEVVSPGDFQETIFALGRIDVVPGRRAVVSSRIAGRAAEVRAMHDHDIEKGEIAVVVESRQFGEPPPRIELAAPISGMVSAVNVVPGQPIEPNDVLIEILDLDYVYALARVPEHLAAKLRKGQPARITAPAVAGPAFEATLEHLGVLADHESGTVEAAFRVKNRDLALRPGMRAEFVLVTEKHSAVTSVPRTAVQGEGASRFVYVKDFDLPNAFLKTPVVIGRSNDRSTEIVSGLFPADEVVTRGAYSLAFAGSGNLSLKEALDSAHGHAHNADGSEIKSGAVKNNAADSDDHGHAHGEDAAHSHERLWMIVSGVLLIALIIVSVRLKKATTARRN